MQDGCLASGDGKELIYAENLVDAQRGEIHIACPTELRRCAAASARRKPVQFKAESHRPTNASYLAAGSGQYLHQLFRPRRRPHISTISDGDGTAAGLKL